MRSILAFRWRVYRFLAILLNTAIKRRPLNGRPFVSRTSDQNEAASTTGVIRKVGQKYHYFGAHHWLPGDHVHDLAIADKTAYIATDKGIGTQITK